MRKTRGLWGHAKQKQLLKKRPVSSENLHAPKARHRVLKYPFIRIARVEFEGLAEVVG
jgi:hypothetical protein